MLTRLPILSDRRTTDAPRMADARRAWMQEAAQARARLAQARMDALIEAVRARPNVSVNTLAAVLGELPNTVRARAVRALEAGLLVRRRVGVHRYSVAVPIERGDHRGDE